MEGCRVHKVAGKPAGHKINNEDSEEVLERESPVLKFILLDKKQKKKTEKKNRAEGKEGGGDRESPATFWSNIPRLQGYQAHSL